MNYVAPFQPNKTSMQIMKLVNGYFVKTRKNWTLMSQKWMISSLKQFYGVRVPRSTLNYNLKILRKQGLIDTVTRHYRNKESGEFIPRVTLYKATDKLKKFFSKIATYFKRCGWLPDIKVIQANVIPVVGVATSKAGCIEEHLKRRKGKRPDCSDVPAQAAAHDDWNGAKEKPAKKAGQQDTMMQGQKARNERTRSAEDKRDDFSGFLRDLETKYA